MTKLLNELYEYGKEPKIFALAIMLTFGILYSIYGYVKHLDNINKRNKSKKECKENYENINNS